MEWLNKIHQGNAIDILKKMPSDFVDCLITSPPYWALRDYKIEPIIWDGYKDCQHEWKLNHQCGQGIDTNFCSICGAWKGSLGLEPTFDLYIKHLCDIFDEVKRVMKKSGTLWVNLGDTFIGSGVSRHKGYGDPKWESKDVIDYDEPSALPQSVPAKCLAMIPFRFAIEMGNRGWILRNVIIWHKPNAMPSSVKDRFTVDFEYLFFFSKSKHYYFETQYEKYTQPMNRWGGEKLTADGQSLWDKGTGQETYRERNLRPNPEGRNKRTVWTITTKGFSESHFAVFPEALCETPINAGCPKFVCSKCGKAKEKIIEIVEHIGHKPRLDEKHFSCSPGQHFSNKTVEKGYTSCPCNAPFNPGIVMDIFAGSGTSCLVAKKLDRNFIGIELNPTYAMMAEERVNGFKSEDWQNKRQNKRLSNF
jgi:site-specific DNA-methyltransferase (adenine-specific)